MPLIAPSKDSHGWTPTLNKMGYMTNKIDKFTQEFLDFCSKNKGAYVFEGGAAYGIATIPALQRGAKVVANDLNNKHLEILKINTPIKLQDNLTLCPGRLPNEIDFLPATFDAIFCSRMLHFLKGKELKTCIKKFFRWLKPYGKVFIIAESPYLRSYQSFIPTYEDKKKKGHKWPGLIEDTKEYLNIEYNNIPKFLNFLDVEMLSDLCGEAGFEVLKSEFIDRIDFPDSLRLDGRESVGIIAFKP